MQRYLCICVLASLKRWSLRKSKEIGVETMKKLLATILALVMALGLCSVSWAEGEIEVSDAAQLKQTISDASSKIVIKLTDNVTMTGEPLDISAGKDVAIDLNGKTLKISGYTGNSAEYRQVKVDGTLTIKDSVGTGVICSDYTGSSGVLVGVNNGGKLYMQGGTITTEEFAKAGNAISVASGAFAEMTGGAVKCGAIRGNRAVNVKGQFVMTGGSVIAEKGDGSENYIIAIEGRDSASVDVRGSSIVAGPEAVSARNSNVSITGGDFTGAMTVKAKSISGGTFSNSVNPTYLADGLKYEVYAGGKYSYYSDFDSAAAAAAAGRDEVIKVGNSNTGVVPFHIDYADGTGVKPVLRMSKDNFELPTPTRSGYTFKGWKIALHEGEQIPGFTGTYTSEQVKDIVFAEAATDGGAINRFSDGAYLTAVWSANSYYYYAPTTTDSKTGSPKTFDTGVGIYAVTALLSVTGMAWAGKKRH